MSAKVFHPGDTVSRYYYFRDKDNVLFDPDTATSQVLNPSKVQVATPTLEKVSNGKYEFNYTLAADAPRGYWTIFIIGTKGASQKTEKFVFAVV